MQATAGHMLSRGCEALCGLQRKRQPEAFPPCREFRIRRCRRSECGIDRQIQRSNPHSPNRIAELPVKTGGKARIQFEMKRGCGIDVPDGCRTLAVPSGSPDERHSPGCSGGGSPDKPRKEGEIKSS